MASLPPRFPLWGGTGRRPRRDPERINGPRTTGERLGRVLDRLARPASGRRPDAMSPCPETGKASEGERSRSRYGGRAPFAAPEAPGKSAAAGQADADPVDPRHLVELWRNWDMVMGPELASLALPLGRRNDIIVVGGEDNLALQELSFQTPELLERVNAFMDAPVFTRVELRLLMGQRPLTLPPDMQAGERNRALSPCPPGLGAHFSSMRPDSPVARCYAAYLRMYGLL